MRLSNTAINTFLECARKYKHHYIDGLRSEIVSSALHFGRAIDEALNVLLLQKKKKLTKEEKDLIKKDPYEIFEDNFRYRVIKKDIGPEDISYSQYMDYYKSDFNPELLNEDDIVELQLYMIISGYITLDDMSILNEDNKDILKERLRDYIYESEIEVNPKKLYRELREKEKEDNLELTDRTFINFASWLSLYRKGELLIKCYEDDIMPQIEEVYSIQKRVNLPNDTGDVLVGVIDLECKYIDDENKYTTDNKTSSVKYKKTDINDNKQLPIYDEYTGNGKASYIVLNKKPKFKNIKECQDCDFIEESNKRVCPKCKGKLAITGYKPIIGWQILKDDINEDKKDLHFQEIDDILNKIKRYEKSKYFPKNTDNCFTYGRKCQFYDLCKSGNTKGLIKK